MALFKVSIASVKIWKQPTASPGKENIIGTIPKGTQLQLEEVQYLPTAIKGKWYKDKQDRYYSQKGLTAVPMPLVMAAAPFTYAWWLENEKYSIPDLWNNDKNQETTIAILDTGINRHVDFASASISGYNFLDNTISFDNDTVGHGTHLTGMIAASGIKSFGIFPNAKLFMAKVCDNTGTPLLQATSNALKDIYEKRNNVDVINMSFNITAKNNANEQQLLAEITDLLKKLSNEKQCILVSASGDEDWEFDSFPASMEECISVGSINQQFLRSPFSTMSQSLDIMAPGEEIESSAGLNETIKLNGTSQAAAFVSALCAMGIMEQKKKGQKNINLLKKALYQTAINNSFPLKEYGHGIISPNSFIQTIKSM